MRNIVDNVKVYGLENSFRVSKFPMAVDTEKCDSEYTLTIERLAQSEMGSGHDNALKGIVVQFDLSFTIKAWTEAERYHWFEIVSSQSTMHKISKMNYDECMIDYVTENTKSELNRLKEIYNKSGDSEDYLRLLYNCPTGLILTAGITTNYRQLKTIYSQRKNHKLPEWKEFCKWIETLPFATLITEQRKVHNSCMVIRDELMKHEVLYDGFLSSIESSLKEQNVSALPFQPEKEIAEKVLKRIIGED